ncbi:3-dehydrosphinganine reductase [Marasmius tenuissimus]|uniref:3-dehydrosphinganine reductase n=1 Tax=Marasmius tenuissimus TaxID=585030 RepID=A0ABR3ADZ9_9AGAR
MVQKGAHVSVVARNQENLAKALALMEEHRQNSSQEFHTYSFDLSTGSESTNALEAVCEPFGGRAPDAVIACPGFERPKFFVEMTEEELTKGMNGAYWVQAWTAWAATRMMVRQGRRGKIVLVSSTLGFMSFVGHASYCPGKHALRALGDALQSELMLYDISVHTFFPPTMVTDSWVKELETKPAITSEIEGPDQGMTTEHAAKVLYKGMRKGQLHIAGDWITNMFRSCSRGAAPRNNVLVDTMYDVFSWIAIPIWRMGVDKKVKAHRHAHQEYLRSNGFLE